METNVSAKFGTRENKMENFKFLKEPKVWNEYEYFNIKNINKLKTILEKIFLYYVIKYPKLKNVDLFFNEFENCVFTWSDYKGLEEESLINIDFVYINNNYDYHETIERHERELTAKEYAVVVLLHEIKHAIDFYYTRNKFVYEAKLANKKEQKKYGEIKHYSFNIEKRTDKFANREFKRLWEKTLTKV